MQHSHKPFDDIHESADTILKNLPVSIADSPAVSAARAAANDFDGYIALGNALVRQFRYREAIEAYTAAIDERPTELLPLRLRAARYLTTLQTDKAADNFRKCLELGGEELDIKYRLGLCCYYAKSYSKAMEYFAECEPIAPDSMKIAAIYWHSLSAFRCGAEPSLLEKYHPGMDVGHHIGYEKCSGVFSGSYRLEDMLDELEKTESDLDFAILAYGLCGYLEHTGRVAESAELSEKLLSRDGFWPCFAYLAAWNDKYN